MKLNLPRGTKVTLGADIGMNHHDIAVLVNDEQVKHVHIEATPRAWDRFLQGLEGCEIKSVYEAGPDGFWLYRHLESRGIACKVVAPSRVPIEPGLRARKNNKRDALRLAELYSRLEALYVPTPEQESDRALVRAREQLVKDRTRAQARIRSLLRLTNKPLRNSQESGTSWCERRLKHLESMELDFQSRTNSLRLMVGELRDLQQRVNQADSMIRQLSKTERYRDLVRRMKAIKGIGLLSAMTFIVEICDPKRFASQAELAAYLGMVPTENSTGDTQTLGGILHGGNKHVRRVLIQNAWIWQRTDPRPQKALKRFYRNHGNQKGVKQKAVVYLARKLASILWAIWRDGSEYRPDAGEPQLIEVIAQEQATV